MRKKVSSFKNTKIMAEQGAVLVHPEVHSDLDVQAQKKQSHIPVLIHSAWSGKSLTTKESTAKKVSPIHSVRSAPASPKHRSHSPSPLASPVHSLPSEKSMPAKKPPDADESKSMPMMTQKKTRIPQPKSRYNMQMESTSLVASAASSEFSSTVNFEQSPDHVQETPENVMITHNYPPAVSGDMLGKQSSSSPSMLYPSSLPAVMGLGKQETGLDPENREETDSTLSFSSLSIPSKVSVTSGKDVDMFSASSSTVTPVHSNSLIMEDISKPTLSAQCSEVFNAKLDLLIEDKETVMKALQEAHANIEFLEVENRTLRDKASSDALKISKQEQIIAQLEQQAESMRLENFNEKIAIGDQEKEKKQKLQTLLIEVTKEKENLSNKLLVVEKDHSLCSKQIKLISSSKDETEKQLSTMRADLLSSQEKIKYLQESMKTVQNERQRYESSLDGEKSRVSDLQASLDSLTSSMGCMTKDVQERCEENNNLKAALQRRDEEENRLNESLKLLKKEKAAALSKNEALVAGKELLEKELEQMKSSLLEAHNQYKSSQLRVRELGQKLSAAECEAKEKEASLSSEAKKSMMVDRENQELKKRLQQADQQLAFKGNELKSITIEKQAADTRLTELEDLLKKKEVSSTQEVLLLNSEAANVKARYKMLQEEVAEKGKKIKALERQQTNLHCSLESEREQKNTLALKATSLEEELLSLKNQYQKLEDQSEEFTKVMERKLLGLKEVENSLNTQLQEKVNELKQKEDELHSTVIQLRQAETELEKTKAKTIEHETQAALSLADVENHKKLCDNLQSKLQLIQDSKHQEIGLLKAQLDSKRSEVSRLNAKLDTVHMEMESMKMALEKSNEALQHERTVLASVQSELTTAENNGTELSSHLSDVEEHMKSLSSMNEGLKAELEDAKIKMKHRAEEIYLLQQRLKEAAIKGEEEKSRSKAQTRHNEEEMQKVIHERKVCQSNLQKVNEVLSVTQEKLASVQNDLEATQFELDKQKEEFNGLQLSMGTETASRNELAKKYTILENQHKESCSLVQDLEDKLSIAKGENQDLKSQLKEVGHHCTTLEGEIKRVEEVKVKRVEQVEGKMTKVVSQYEKDLSDIKKANETLQVTVDKLSEEASSFKFECASLKAKLEKGSAVNQQLKLKIAEDSAKDLLQVKKISELEKQLANEAESKMAINRELAIQLSKEHDLELKLDEVQHKLYSAMVSKDNIDAQLQEEKLKVVSLQSDLNETETELKAKRNVILKQKELTTELKLQSEAELSQLKQKYHCEAKALKEKIKDLQAEINLLKASCSSKSSAIDKLQTSCDDLERANRMVQSQLEKTKREREEKNESLKLSEVRIQSLEIQLAQLQLEVTTLSKSQLEFENYKKRIEASSREELQRVLTEVTQHMEEQHTAHHHLEKLRKENETIALKEKERQIDHLKAQLKRKKQELKKDRLHIESLEIESRFLKSQHKDSANTRYKIENHLGKISDALSISTSKSFSSSPAPHASSTPVGAVRNKSFQ